MKQAVYAVEFTERNSRCSETETYYVSATDIEEAIEMAHGRAMQNSDVSPFHVGTVYELEYTEYGSTGTCAFWDCATGAYFNGSGQRLRDPKEYNQYSEGYTPFGDE